MGWNLELTVASTVPITRRLEFDAAHRIQQHESKCRAIHGHRYVAEVSVRGTELDHAGRVIDFGKVKEIIGGWIDDNWDHTTILQKDDDEAIAAISPLNKEAGQPVYLMTHPPTVENMVLVLGTVANQLLSVYDIRVSHVRLYETPNCWADWELQP